MSMQGRYKRKVRRICTLCLNGSTYGHGSTICVHCNKGTMRELVEEIPAEEYTLLSTEAREELRTRPNKIAKEEPKAPEPKPEPIPLDQRSPILARLIAKGAIFQ